MRTKQVAVLAAALLLVALSVAVESADQMSGTWKMNAAKSKYSPGPAPKELTVKTESSESSYKVDATGTDAEGKPIHVQYDAKLDGKDYPVTGQPYADTVSVKRVDPSTVESTMKKDGKVTMTVTTTLAKDGKSRTSTFKGTNEKGQAVHNVVVSDKQ
jgi:hypothetical protein